MKTLYSLRRFYPWKRSLMEL
ncbi:hypothetical protein LINPERHAP1_LOCUS44566 [Linum perenne]